MQHSIPKLDEKKLAMKKTTKRKYKTAVQLARYINEYFDSLIGINEQGDKYIKIPPSVTGLCEHLEINRSTLIRYEDDKDYKRVIDNAKILIERYLEESLNMGFATSSMIFNLKNNYGWQDKTEVDTNITSNKKLEDILLELKDD